MATYHVIKSEYSDTKYRVRFRDEISIVISGFTSKHLNKRKLWFSTKQNYETERFMYNVTLIECVKSFNYLGIQVSRMENLVIW